MVIESIIWVLVCFFSVTNMRCDPNIFEIESWFYFQEVNPVLVSPFLNLVRKRRKTRRKRKRRKRKKRKKRKRKKRRKKINQRNQRNQRRKKRKKKKIRKTRRTRSKKKKRLKIQPCCERAADAGSKFCWCILFYFSLQSFPLCWNAGLKACVPIYQF